METFVFVGIIAFCFILGPVFRLWDQNRALPVFLLPLAFGLVLTHSLGLQDVQSVQREIDLLISVSTGLLGFQIGLQGKKYLAHQRVWLSSGLVAGCLFAVTFVLVSFFLAFVNQWEDIGWGPLFFEVYALRSLGQFFEFSSDSQFLAPALAAIACAVSPGAVQVLLVRASRQAPMLRRLEHVGLLCRALGIGVFGVVLSSFRPWQSAGQIGLSIAEWSALSVFSGVFCGFLFSLFIGRIDQQDKVFLSAIGAIIFASGIGKSLGVSPLFVNLTFGLTVAYFSRHARQVSRTLDNIIWPVQTMVFVLAGLCLVAFDLRFALLGGVLVAGRFLALVMGKALIGGIMRHPVFGAPSALMPLVAQDYVGMALALSFFQRFPASGVYMLVVCVVVASLTRLAVGRFAYRFAYNAGELTSDVKEKKAGSGNPPSHGSQQHGGSAAHSSTMGGAT